MTPERLDEICRTYTAPHKPDQEKLALAQELAIRRPQPSPSSADKISDERLALMLESILPENTSGDLNLYNANDTRLPFKSDTLRLALTELATRRAQSAVVGDGSVFAPPDVDNRPFCECHEAYGAGLIEALEPFAKKMDWPISEKDEGRQVFCSLSGKGNGASFGLEVSDFIRARKALNATQEGK